MIEIKKMEPGLLPKFTDEEAEIFQKYLLGSEHAWVGYISGELVCVWGLIPQSVLSDTAYVWSWTSAVVQKHKLSFFKASREAIGAMLQQYPRLVGLCLGRSIWLKHLGARFGGPIGKYIYFEIGAG